MISDIEKGEVKAVIVKGLSRLGRDHLITGYYMEVFFPNNDVRFVAIYDNVDSENGDNEFAPFKNIFNEWYARDTSKKIRAVFQNKGKSEEILCSIPPYGYVKDPDSKKHWLIDEEAAEVVRKIYELYLSGTGTKHIADYLENNGVPAPTDYFKSKGITPRGAYRYEPVKWSCSVVKGILSRQEYIGDVINFKTHVKSFKNHSIVKNPVENMAIFKGVNEPIISEQDWQNAQAILAKNKRVPRNKEPDLFQSYFYCADCGSKMYLRRKKGDLANYFCSGYSKGTVKCTTHLIKYSTLIELVLNNIRSVVAAANLDKEKFAKEIKRKADSDNDKEIKRTIKEADKMKARCAELDKIIQKLFEDRVNGRISDERYFKMTESYEKEQAEINEKLISYQEKIDAHNSGKRNVEYFLKLVNKYSEITELTPQILFEFIDRIEIHQADKDANGRFQVVDIYYKGIGVLK